MFAGVKVKSSHPSRGGKDGAPTNSKIKRKPRTAFEADPSLRFGDDKLDRKRVV